MIAACEVAIAGVLHDVGKLLHRASWPLSQQAARMEQMLCPTRDGGARASHRHVLWTSDFVEQFARRLPAEMNRGRIHSLAAYHHRPSDVEHWLVAEADRLASGHDRRRDEDDEDHPGHFRQVALQSVFWRLGIDGQGAPPPAPAWLPGPLTVSDGFLPLKEFDRAGVEGAWGGLAKALVAEAQELNLSALSPTLAVQVVAGLSERFLSFMPASAVDRPDVSLHDHVAVTAALACAAYRYHRLSDSLTEGAIRDRQQEKYRFLVGSLSGIQDFIFTLPDEQRGGLARTYRAKSFYLSVLTEAVAWKLLSAAGLPAVNCVMSAGGRFVILADATAETLDVLRRTARELQRWFIEHHLGMLRLNLSLDLTARGADLLGGHFRDVYGGIERQAEGAKVRGMTAWLREGTTWQPERFLHTSQNVREMLRQWAQRAQKLGRQLPRAAMYGLFERREDADVGLLDEPVECLGLWLQLGGEDRWPHAERAVLAVAVSESASRPAWMPYRPVANYVCRLTKDDCDFLLDFRAQQAEPAQLPAGGVGPAEAGIAEEPRVGDTATFEHLAVLARRRSADGPRGQAMLACLKADVDRLGLLLSQGFGSDVSFARVASASRLLDVFFKGHLTSRLQEKASRYRCVYTVFAGGDDLMLIGSWHVMFELAAELRRWLDGLSGANPAVSLSAALVLSRPRTPPSHLARLAEEQLDHAKQAGRNRIAALGRVLTWEQFETALAMGRRLDEMLRAPKEAEGLRLNTSFVYRLLQYARSAGRVHEALKEGRDVPVGDLTWRSHFLYDLRRNVESSLGSHPTDRQQRDLRWLKELMYPGMRAEDMNLAPLILGATYALYLNRGACE